MQIRVITGGKGIERLGSLASGRDVGQALGFLNHKINVVDLVNLEDALAANADEMVFLTTHGWYGEDGKIQGALELLGIPYTGSGVTASAVGMHKPSCLRIAQSLDLDCPVWTIAKPTNCADAAAREAARINTLLGQDVFVKPSSGGGSLGAGVAHGNKALAELLLHLEGQGELIVSKLIQGTDVSVALLQRHGSLQCLPMLATFYDGDFYSYEIKHDAGMRRHECPANLSSRTRDRMEAAARGLFKALGCNGFARFDFIVDKEGVAWFLEVNTLPGMSRAGNFSNMAYAAGMSYEDLVQCVVDTRSSTGQYRP